MYYRTNRRNHAQWKDQEVRSPGNSYQRLSNFPYVLHWMVKDSLAVVFPGAQ